MSKQRYPKGTRDERGHDIAGLTDADPCPVCAGEDEEAERLMDEMDEEDVEDPS